MKNVSLFHPPIFKDEWLEELSDTFSSKWIGEGPKVKEFERQFGQHFDYNYVVTVNSGTSALELAYHLVGIESGDKVITTCLTCSASNLPLVRRKARIIFADIDPNTMTMSYDDLVSKTIGRVKAIVVVNLGGISCDPRIFEFAKKKGIPVIVDACQSLGVTEPNGDYVCYSFQAIKNFVCGDGGALILRNENEYKRAKKLRWFGIDRDARFSISKSKREVCMNMEEAGYKYHMNDISASLLLVGLKHSDEIINHRTKLCNKYKTAMDDKGIQSVFGGSCWLYCILIDKRDEFIDKMAERGIECDLVHLRNDIYSVFGKKRQNLPNMNYVEQMYVYLPLHYRLTEDDVDYVIKNINEIV